ncbi:MAG TPA: type II toxin-antitoxin system VapC family toxin [Fimbriiglobus sp.]|jgi:tRNA(fMet)-specific endonuclease VapC|nr:type II toxin-antitoxin system VapC family toxin [Fimbriiglobus sp.]
MRRYLLDTNALGDFINRRHEVDDRVRGALRAGHRVGTCPPAVGEYRYGLELSTSRDENLKRFRVGLDRLLVWPFDVAAAEEFGRLRAALRRAGRPMQPIDIMIAAVALTLGNCTVVTTDSDLSAVPGLAVENWAA